jgi:hypothetical protein
VLSDFVCHFRLFLSPTSIHVLFMYFSPRDSGRA